MTISIRFNWNNQLDCTDSVALLTSELTIKYHYFISCYFIFLWNVFAIVKLILTLEKNLFFLSGHCNHYQWPPDFKSVCPWVQVNTFARCSVICNEHSAGVLDIPFTRGRLEITVILDFDHQNLFSPDFSPSDHLSQMWLKYIKTIQEISYSPDLDGQATKSINARATAVTVMEP